MSTTTVAPTVARQPTQTVPVPTGRAFEAESRVLLRNIDWALYQAILAARGDDPVPRITYLDGELELMAPSYWHEILKERLTLFIMMVARGLGRNFRGAGSTLWEREDLLKGKEPDSCFYLEHEPSVRGLRQIDLSVQPPPDLAIEIEVSRPLASGIDVYAALGVPEVWRCDGLSVHFLHLQANGVYNEREMSRAFPMLRTWEVVGWLPRADEMGDMEWSSAVETWARTELAARPVPNG